MSDDLFVNVYIKNMLSYYREREKPYVEVFDDYTELDKIFVYFDFPNNYYTIKKHMSIMLLLSMVFLLFGSCSGLNLFSKAEYKLSQFNQIIITDNND